MGQYDSRLSKLESRLAVDGSSITLEELVAEPDREIPERDEAMLRCGERGAAFPLAWFDQFEKKA